MEYAQAFLAGRSFASEMNSIYTLSGAFTAFRKSAILKSQLYNSNTISEDTQVTFQMRYLYDEKIEMCEDALFFVDPIEDYNKLYTQRQRWQRGSLEVACLFQANKLLPHKVFTDPNISTLMFDHTFAFPRLIWYVALLCLMALNVSVKTIAFSVILLFALYIIVGYIYFFCVLKFLKMAPDVRKYYLSKWYIVALLPLFNLMVFFIRVAGIINSINTPGTWKTKTLSQEKTAFKTELSRELHAVSKALTIPAKAVNKQAPTCTPARATKHPVWYIMCGALLLLSCIIVGVCLWVSNTLNVGMAEIMVTLTGNLEGTGGTTFERALSYCLPIIACGACVIAAIMCTLKFTSAKFAKTANNKNAEAVTGTSTTAAPQNTRGHQLFSWAHSLLLNAGILALVISLAFANSTFGITQYIKTSSGETQIYETYYVDPQTTTITAPAQKRNLIYIYLESMETTYASEAQGGNQQVNIIENLTNLAHENISFGSTDTTLGGFHSLQNTNWTFSALLSTESGLPYAASDTLSNNESSSTYFSGMTTIGDILADEGYNQEFLCGSDAKFGGRAEFFQNHGNYDIFDLYTARSEGYIPNDYNHWWGYEDYIMFDIAKDEVTRLNELDEPFNLTMLTVDLHYPEGYECDQCRYYYENTTANVADHTDIMVKEFIDWCKTQPFYENTTIVITGDHPRMDTCLVDGVDYYDRTVYNCFINAPFDASATNTNRVATPLDIFPTTLASLGFNIDGERLGLGTNLFSDEQTLAEQHGFDWLDAEVQKTSSYYIANFAPELADASTTNTQDAEGSEGSEGSVGVNSHASAIPEAQPSGVAENAEIRDTEGVTGADAANEPTEIYATKETLDEQ
jgi:phosphoglycerol transferase